MQPLKIGDILIWKLQPKTQKIKVSTAAAEWSNLQKLLLKTLETGPTQARVNKTSILKVEKLLKLLIRRFIS